MCEDIDVLLLAAGFGTRLRPLTDSLPKPLVPLCKRPLIDWNLSLIARNGFRRVFINLHYLPELIEEYVGDGSRWGLEVIFVREDPILDTGGAIRNIAEQLRGDLLLTINSDAMFDVDLNLGQLIAGHRGSSLAPLATLLVRENETPEEFGVLRLNGDGRICSFLGVDYISGALAEDYLYTGVQLLSLDLLSDMPEKGAIFSITRDTYRRVLERGGVLAGQTYDGFWSDVGTVDRLHAAEAHLKSRH
ncbi:MAG: sugar phosphate nucleotidyltransferase [bacterium]|nr:sugar phosphate nucleotidyltransferase [bacterium]